MFTRQKESASLTTSVFCSWSLSAASLSSPPSESELSLSSSLLCWSFFTFDGVASPTVEELREAGFVTDGSFFWPWIASLSPLTFLSRSARSFASCSALAFFSRSATAFAFFSASAFASCSALALAFRSASASAAALASRAARSAGAVERRLGIGFCAASSGAQCQEPVSCRVVPWELGISAACCGSMPKSCRRLTSNPALEPSRTGLPLARLVGFSSGLKVLSCGSSDASVRFPGLGNVSHGSPGPGTQDGDLASRFSRVSPGRAPLTPVPLPMRSLFEAGVTGCARSAAAAADAVRFELLMAPSSKGKRSWE
mmetsp:Transcript_14098/g.26143  ORF Transcript_14098/g.26143 Transcript_14098/m.26143 type:complete len:314 (+) Transcript_14098:2640-3581(+)